jgi:hypothetical protein
MISPHCSTSLSVGTWGAFSPPSAKLTQRKLVAGLTFTEPRGAKSDGYAVRVMCLQIASLFLSCRVACVYLSELSCSSRSAFGELTERGCRVVSHC